MSRLGKMPIPIPKGVKVAVNGDEVVVTGAKGTLSRKVDPEIAVALEQEQLIVSLKEGQEDKGNLHGLWRQLLNNMVVGMHTPFQKELELVGVGFRAAVQGRVLDLQIGKSHPTKLAIPNGIEVAVDKSVNILIKGADKQLVGQFAANVRALKKPEPYKGKGIRYKDEYVRRKAGKAGKK